MSVMAFNNFGITGLTDQEVATAREAHGRNELNFKKENKFFAVIKDVAKEPMVVILLVASGIYFASGDTGDGIFLSAAIVLISAISLYQDSRSRNALDQLKTLTQPNCKVVRNGAVIEIKNGDLVPGDSLVVEEGGLVAADGTILHSNDFSVNESILTGESFPVFKDSAATDNRVYQGTTVASGLAICQVTATGRETKLGKIGESLESIKAEKTPLEVQINDFVKKMVIVGIVVFAIVWGINYSRSGEVLDSLLKALTLAMSILPEEIPVAFTTFMALGAWRLMKMGIVVKQIKTVETLGSATVICTDKTGTLTENKMSLAKVWSAASKEVKDPADSLSADEGELIRLAMWASEPIPFDPMEVALHDAYSKTTGEDERPSYKMVHEYPLDGKPPMMTHVFGNKDGKRVIAVKGAPEAVMAAANLNPAAAEQVNEVITKLATEGYRLLGVGEAIFEGEDFPAKQEDFAFGFKGIVAFYDPPKKNIRQVLEGFYTAGISVKIITGDNSATTNAIAAQIGFRNEKEPITGADLLAMNDAELDKAVTSANIFTRMFPEAKLKIINALKAKHEIVAMTGDGVNDGPALKAAHIGIAMGKKGTEIAKQASSLILLEDDLSKMVDAVAMGRRIYTNLKKAIQYIISIHVPIVLTVFVPLVAGWLYPNIFSPVHIIFLELIMGPTCSIIYENEPMERNTMHQPPRPLATTFFNWKELATSVLQGLVISAGTLAVYQYAVHQGLNEATTRTMVFTTLISANIFLTLVNRSFYYSVLTTLRYRNNLVWMIIGATVLITGVLLYAGSLSSFFKFVPLGYNLLLISVVAGGVSVLWYEVVKWGKRR